MKNRRFFLIYKSVLAISLAVIFFLSGLIPAGAASGSTLIYSVKVKDAQDKVSVYVKAHDKFEYKIINMNDPYKCLILEIFPAQLEKSAKLTQLINKGIIKEVRVAQFSDNPDIVRVVVDLKENAKYEVFASKDKKGLSFAVNNFQSSAISDQPKPLSPAKVVESKENKSESTKKVVELVKTPVEDKEIKPTSVKKVVEAIKPQAEVKVTKVAANINPPSVEVKKEIKIVKTQPVPEKKYTAKSNKKADVKNKSTEKLLTLSYDDEDIDYILRDLSQKSGKNIVFDSSVKGKITVQLTKVNLEKALHIILSASGYKFKKIENIYLVGTPENLAKTTPASLMKSGKETIEVIPLVYNKAKDFVANISKNVPDAVISVNERLNSIVVRGSEELVKYVKELVSQLDQVPSETPVSSLKTEVVKLNYSNAADIKSLVEAWFPGLSLLVDERLNSFILRGEGEKLAKIIEFINKVDRPKRQVELDVKVVDLTETGSKSLGVSYGAGGNIFSTTLSEVIANGTAWQSGAAYTLPTYVDLPFQTFARSALSIPMAVNYLVSKGDAKVIASPKVVTMSGEKAYIMVGDKYPMTYSDPRAGGLQAKDLDIAAKLSVTPTITPDGCIVAEITPEVSEMAASQTSQYPETTTRKLTTNIVVKDGQTIILGGLYKKNYSTSKTRIPFLGDIPVLGEMFSNSSASFSRDELVIMITPKIVKD